MAFPPEDYEPLPLTWRERLQILFGGFLVVVFACLIILIVSLAGPAT